MRRIFSAFPFSGFAAAVCLLSCGDAVAFGSVAVPARVVADFQPGADPGSGLFRHFQRKF